jgi:hypothetical protein
MTNLYRWTGVHHLRRRRDEKMELGFREQALLEVCQLPTHLLPTMRLYHRWLAGQHEQASRVSRTAETHASNYLSGDPTNLNWVAFITGGGVGMVKACGLPPLYAAELIGCALFLCDVAWSGGRSYTIKQRIIRLQQQTNWVKHCREQPNKGIYSLGQAHLSWWLTQPESHTEVAEAPDEEICLPGLIQQLTVDQQAALLGAAKLDLQLLHNKHDNVAWLKVWVPQNLSTARKRRGQRRPASFADLHEPPYALLPSAVS